MRPKKLCSFEGCGRKHAANGYCHGHNWQHKQGRAIANLKAKGVRISDACCFPGCGKPYAAHGYCRGHYHQLRKGKVLAPLRRPGFQPNPNKAGHIRKSGKNMGYKTIYVPGHPCANAYGYAPEHRVILSDFLEKSRGEPLRKTETVHHKNGIRNDNRLENLELRSGQHGNGQNVTDLTEWAIKHLKAYAPEKLAA